MCGLCGVVIGEKPRRRVAEIDALADTFIRLLIGSEHRGPHATGVASVKRNGAMQVAKEPLPARSFIQNDQFIDWLMGVDRQITYLMGHTRWPSQGSVRNPENNHPIVLPVGKAGGHVALTHNGTLRDVAPHFRRLGLHRTMQVDSELLARIAQHHVGDTGIALDGFLETLALLDGSMSAALVATANPNEVILLKGNMPLEVRIHQQYRAVVYASEARILGKALQEDGWDIVPLDFGEGVIINTDPRMGIQRFDFTFRGMANGWTARSVTGVT